MITGTSNGFHIRVGDETSQEASYTTERSGFHIRLSDETSQEASQTTQRSFKVGAFNDDSLRSRSSHSNPVVAEKEQRAVLWARMIVLIVLLIALLVVTCTMYFVVSENERKEFENQFSSRASEISSLVQENARNAVDAAEAFSLLATSHANALNSQWPFVTIRDFTSRAERFIKLSSASSVIFAPIVYPNDVQQWATYSATNSKSYYTEFIQVTDYNATVEDLIQSTIPLPWLVDVTTFQPQLVDTNQTNLLLLGWQYHPLINDILGFPPVNLELLNTGFEVTFNTSSQLKIPSFDFNLIPILDPETGQLVDFEVQSQMMQPVFDTIYNGKTSRKELNMVASIIFTYNWTAFLNNIISKEIEDIDIVLFSKCSLLVQNVTYHVAKEEVIQLGTADMHDTKYDDMVVNAPLLSFDFDNKTRAEIDKSDACFSEIIMSIYPTNAFEHSFYTSSAYVFSGAVAAVFAFTSLVFLIFDVTVRRRQTKVMARIIRQDKIVLNMFPKEIRDRLYNLENPIKIIKNSKNGSKNGDSNGASSAGFGNPDLFGAAPLAELYPSATIVFADIVGFTAWSSAREPPQVFHLLENIYSAFDKIAYRNGVFKIETVGDCYVAVAGLPEKCDDHAVAVAKFARDCLQKMGGLTHKLEVLLGPDTADLGLRVGMHSGQVTAGVLRSDKARFQLFGDTVNTASRMESTSSRSRIQVSTSTANALIKAGRRYWLTPRNGTIFVKGKGEMQTYWLETREESILRAKLVKCKRSMSTTPLADIAKLTDESDDDEQSDDYSDDGKHRTMTKMERLVEWNVEVLSFLLQQIMVAREQSNGNSQINKSAIAPNLTIVEEEFRRGSGREKTTVLEEFKEIITLPVIGAKELRKRKNPNSVALSASVVSQLRDLLKNIALMYNNNPFHNFEHASHVTASVRKLLTRIVNEDQTNFSDFKDRNNTADHSYGITSDPLTQFAVVFSAVIHDADHPGVPNAQLVQENTRNAQIYKNKSIAEQNSVDLTWALLMSPNYTDLRGCIYSNAEELKRFRQLVVNTVMATDIVDRELQALRKARWEKAFSSENSFDSTPELDMNRKATIVIEHLIQASDVSHTMQHWKIYKNWNERFFFELYRAYKAGRSATDPSLCWYKGEIGFFDFYIIPLAKKLENCGVFGVSSLEYLNYAQSNREEWVREGEKIVEEYLENYKKLAT